MRFKKGELNFYKDSTKLELQEIYKKFGDPDKHLEFFFEEYRYDYVERKWTKNVPDSNV